MATHLKSLAKRARLNEGRVKAARVYKARVAALISERAELRDQEQNMMEEAIKLKSDLRYTRTSCGQLGKSCMLLEMSCVIKQRCRREASEAASSIERLTEECHGLRGDLQRQETLVVQRDEAITSLRDEACTQWASGWLAFQKKAANAYPDLDLNFDILSDEEAKDSFSADCFGEPNTPAETRSPSSPSAPSSDV